MFNFVAEYYVLLTILFICVFSDHSRFAFRKSGVYVLDPKRLNPLIQKENGTSFVAELTPLFLSEVWQQLKTTHASK
jgi:hypothetical protein